MRVRITLEVEIHDENSDDIWMNVNDDVVPIVKQALVSALHDFDYNADAVTSAIGPAWKRKDSL
jgi:hypothetical protein